MYRYAAFYRYDSSPEAQHLFASILGKIQNHWPGWSVALQSSDLHILEWADAHTRAQRHDLEGERGRVFGYLFAPKPSGATLETPRRAPKLIDEQTTNKIISTEGKWLRDHYWGSYVAIYRNKNGDGIRAFRGPFARIGCFHFKAKGVSVLFSDVRLLAILKEYGAEIDWSLAPLYLGYAYFVSEKIPFHNTDYLISGQCVEIAHRKIKTFYLWDPEVNAAAPPIDDVRTARDNLRQVTVSCMDAWASAFPRALIMLSGGFDSSVLTGLMATATNKPEIVCITHSSGDAESDEQYYAQLTAQKWGNKLIEFKTTPESLAPKQLLNCPQRPWPINSSVDWNFHRAVARLSQRYDAPAIFTGEGGDATFVRYCGGISCDYVFDHGLGKDTLKVAFAEAMVDDKSVWRVLSNMVRQRVGIPPKGPVLNNDDEAQTGWGLHPDIAELIGSASPSGPWEHSALTLAPGKAHNLDGQMYPFYEGVMFDDVPFVERLEPILSQPIVEISLRIPTYIHQHNGRERGLAREAFADYLIDEVRLRRYKTIANGFFYRILVENTSFYRDFLLGGILAEKNLLDKAVLERAFKDPALRTSAQCVKLMHYADVEAWARSWS